MTADPSPRTVRRGPSDFSLPVLRTHLDRLTAGAPDWLAADRTAGFEAFEALPPETNLLYTTYLDLRAADLAETAIAGPRPIAAVPEAPLPDDADGVLEIREGIPSAAALSPAARAAGVTLTSLGNLLATDPARARELLDGTGSLPSDDRFAQLTRALWSDGIVLDVPAAVRLDRPILLRWAAGVPAVATVGRTFIRLGAGARASVVEELVPTGPDIDCAAGETVPQAFLAGTTEVTLGAGASLSVASIQDLGPRTVTFQHRTARIGEGASLQWALAQLGSRLTRSRVDNRLEGDRSSVEQAEIVFGGEDQLFDLTSYTRHVGRDTTGNLLSKGALLDRARAYMKGMITIERSAVGTDSYLGEFGMNLSRNARSVAIPSLEIDQPDCRRAAHASSIGPIDEAQLFYLESRGIPPDEARKFIVLGFLEPVVARVPLADAQDLLRTLLEAKWDVSAGNHAADAVAVAVA
jgi:ABC-type transport system involved in Fe-S cluster assembly, permease component